MRFEELLLEAIRRSEIPLRFEPGAEESVAKPVTELLAAWLDSHRPTAESASELLASLKAELRGEVPVPE